MITIEIQTWKNPTLEFAESIMGKLNIGSEDILFLTTSKNGNNKWATISYTRNKSTVLQNTNKLTIRLA